MRVLLIDDMRDMHVVSKEVSDKITAYHVARTFEQGIDALAFGPWDILYLDHDLGDPSPSKTGYGIMCFLEANPELLPKRIELVTSNPVGRQNMKVVIEKLYGDKND